MKKILSSNMNIIALLTLFMIIQPFLDANFLFEDPRFIIFGLTIPTIVRTLFIGIIFIITFIKSNNKIEKIGIVIYFVILGIFGITHHFISSSNMDIPSTFKYSIVTEISYLVRMILPLMLMYITKKSNIKYENFIEIILYSSIIIGIVIIISNTFLILYTSYESESLTIKASWIDWIFGDISKYKFEELTSKGWFYMANQVSGLMLLLLPFCINDMMKKIKKSNFLATIVLTFSMIILGTRTSAYGWILVYVSIISATIILYKLKYLKKINITSIKVTACIFLVFLGLLFVAPIKTREYTRNLKPTEAPALKDGEDVYKYIDKYHSYYGIPDSYVYELYSYKYDYEFWLDTFDKSKDHVLDFRELETLMTNRIVEKNNKLKYKLFGYSFSKMRNGKVYVEKDFIAQYITIGIVGVLVIVAPYFIYIFNLVIKRFKKKKIDLNFVTFIISMIAVFGSSIFTGHILDELFVMLYVGFILGYYLKIGVKNEKN